MSVAPRWLPAVAGFAAVAAALAALAGSRAADVVKPAEPAAPAGRMVSVGPARLVVPADWRAVSPSKADLALLDGRRAAVFQSASRPWMRVLAAFDPTVRPSLVPDALHSAVLAGVPAPTLTRVGGWPAWTYPAEFGRAVGRGGSVTGLATTAGVLGVACTTVTGLEADPDCASDIDSVTVSGAAALIPSESLALAVHLPTALDELNRARSQDRARLRSARTNEAQALAAKRLAEDHRAAARSLRRRGGAAAAPLVGDLTTVSDGYRELARAADGASRVRFASAAAGLRRAEAVLAGGVAAVPRPATTEVVTRVSTPRQDGDASGPGGVPPILFVFLTLLAVAAGAATGNSETPSRLSRVVGRRT